jgi:hypothetical protein
VAKAVRDTIDGFATDLDFTDPRYFTAQDIRQQTGIVIQYIETEDERDIENAPLEGQAQPLFGVTIDARFLYEV